MHCTGYSVVQGTTISSFDVEVLDVAGGEAAADRPRILVQVSGPAVDATGIGPGLLRLADLLPGRGGRAARHRRDLASRSTSTAARSRWRRRSRRSSARRSTCPSRRGVGARRTAARARRGDSAICRAAEPLGERRSTRRRRQRADRERARRAGRRPGARCWRCPPGRSGPSRRRRCSPGSAVAVGYSNGDVRTSAIGTVAYVDGDRVWVVRPPARGRRRAARCCCRTPTSSGSSTTRCRLGAIASTYKLAALRARPRDGHQRRLQRGRGAHRRAPAHGAGQRDRPRRGHQRARNVVNTSAADEAAVDLPSGGSWTSFDRAARGRRRPPAACSAARPARLTGEMCARITIAEIKKPLRFCNRYVSASGGQGDDGGVGQRGPQRRGERPRRARSRRSTPTPASRRT